VRTLRAALAAAVLAAVSSAPARAESLYDAPAPGSYELPVIGSVDEHTLLAHDGKPGPLLGLGDGQIGVVSFIYRTCGDANGCPLALMRLQALDRELAREPELARRVRLVTASFDPKRDTPVQMADLRGHMAPKSDWRFLTAPDRRALAPVLSDYGQDVAKVIDANGQETEALRHVLKVFLIDSDRRVRAIYSSGFLDTRLVLADIRTVLGK
jgi:cytochrome c peroxidase